MYARPNAPLPIGGVIDDAIKLYRESFRRCWQISLLGSLLKGAYGVYMTLTLFNGIGLAGGAAGAASMMRVWRSSSLGWLSLLDLALTVGVYGALIVMQEAVAEDRQLTAAEALGLGYGRLPRALLAGFVSWLVVAVGFVLLLIPGFYLLGGLCLWPMAMYVDDAGAMGSLQASRDLVRGHWWRTATILGVAFIIMLVFSMITAVLMGVAAVFLPRDILSFQIASQLLSVVVYVFIFPMLPAALLATYHDLKLRHQGMDLAARVEALPKG